MGFIIYNQSKSIYDIIYRSPGIPVFAIVLQPSFSRIQNPITRLVFTYQLQYPVPNYSYLYPDSNYLGLYLLYEYARGEGVLGFFLTWIAIYVLPLKKILDS